MASLRTFGAEIGELLLLRLRGGRPPLKVSAAGKPRPIVRSADRTGPSAASAAIDERLEPGAAYAPAPAALVSSARPLEPTPQSARAAAYYSERCCGIPASRARTSVSR